MRAALCIGAALALAACGSSRMEGEPEAARARGDLGAPAARATSAASAPATVRGTVLDASSGRPLAGALVQGPGGTQSTSDRDGRFELQRLPVGAPGEILATTEDGRSGRNHLRSIREGVLEVVVFVR